MNVSAGNKVSALVVCESERYVETITLFHGRVDKLFPGVGCNCKHTPAKRRVTLKNARTRSRLNSNDGIYQGRRVANWPRLFEQNVAATAMATLLCLLFICRRPFLANFFQYLTSRMQSQRLRTVYFLTLSKCMLLQHIYPKCK
jgi:hypothetical protein